MYKKPRHHKPSQRPKPRQLKRQRLDQSLKAIESQPDPYPERLEWKPLG